MSTIYTDTLIALTESSTRITVYIEMNPEERRYVLKVMHKDGTKTVVMESYVLSSILREFAETVAQFSGNYCHWNKLT